jgi:hypothetical protein
MKFGTMNSASGGLEDAWSRVRQHVDKLQSLLEEKYTNSGVTSVITRKDYSEVYTYITNHHFLA